MVNFYFLLIYFLVEILCSTVYAAYYIRKTKVNKIPIKCLVKSICYIVVVFK